MFQKLIQSILKDRGGYVSRKLAAAWILTGLSTVLLLFSYPWNYYMSASIEPVLTGDHFVTLLGLLWSVYFTANVAGEISTNVSRTKEKEVEEYTLNIEADDE